VSATRKSVPAIYKCYHKQTKQSKYEVIEVTAKFSTVGELVLSSSGKTVKIYHFQAGKRVLIGQTNRQTLHELTEKRCLTAHISKYENVSSGETP
jgi:hypothetical protein